MPRAPLLAALLVLGSAAAARADDFGQATVDFSALNKRRDEGGAAAKSAPEAAGQCPAEPPPSDYDGPRRGMGIATTDPRRKLPPRLTQTPDDAKAIVKLLNPEWYYDWDPEPVPGISLQFIPLVEVPGQGAAAVEKAKALGSPAVLGYNEPDLPWGSVHDKSTQKVYVPQALAPDGWAAMSAQAGDALAIGSPAVAMNLKKDGWMDQFMAGGPRVDFVAMHWYGPVDDVSTFVNAVKATYRRYCRPIWITEFGAYGWKTNAVNAADAAVLTGRYGLPIMTPPADEAVENPNTIAKTQDFMRAALAWLDSEEGKRYVQRYAWDPPPVPLPPTNASNPLWYKDEQGRVKLTELGEIYAR